jgi:hypothetical protein
MIVPARKQKALAIGFSKYVASIISFDDFRRTAQY